LIEKSNTDLEEANIKLEALIINLNNKLDSHIQYQEKIENLLKQILPRKSLMVL
jgi:hypothetical protein